MVSTQKITFYKSYFKSTDTSDGKSHIKTDRPSLPYELDFKKNLDFNF